MALPFTGAAVTLNVYQGAECIWSAIYSQTDNTTSPPTTTPVDLSDYTPKAQIRTQPGGQLLLDITDFVALEPDAVTGRVLITIPGSATAALKQPGTWDLFLVPTDTDDAICLFSGAVALELANTTDV